MATTLVVVPPVVSSALDASWAFSTYATGGSVTDTISLGGGSASSLVVDEVPNATILPEAACGALRGEPCRTYVAAANGG